ncbi:MAG: pyruvate ferredoxin oxidoreductase, partial [Syntrophales bacterium]|nr:pyruvate ferredoxin oxidoreductase [Syntrophales bacterium]
VSFGGPNGPVCSEVKAALYDQKERPVITNNIIGLGGRDVVVADFVKMMEQAIGAQNKKPAKAYEIYGVRGS